MSSACQQTSTPQTNEVIDVEVAVSARIEVCAGVGQDVGGSSLASLVLMRWGGGNVLVLRALPGFGLLIERSFDPFCGPLHRGMKLFTKSLEKNEKRFHIREISRNL